MAQAFTYSANVSLISRLRAGYESVQASWARYQEYTRTYEELDSLDNRELADIGISRAQISDLAREHVYGA